MRSNNTIFRIKGMQRDLAASAASPEFAFENRNIRIMSIDDNTLLNILNEKGNKEAQIIGIDGGYIKGIPIGQAVIDDNLIIFSTDSSNELYPDRIYKLWFDNNILNGTVLYSGNLKFSPEHPIETLAYYENEAIKKVYWTDGLNQMRYINIEASEEERLAWNDNSFNFVPDLKLQHEISISKNQSSNGTFDAGVIQYVFTYFNQYGSESNIFYTSPLYYLSYLDRGGSPEDKVSNSFDISIDKYDPNFDYVRVYAIVRTSINATPTVRRVIDLKTSTTRKRVATPVQTVIKNNQEAQSIHIELSDGSSGSLAEIGLPYLQSTDSWQFTSSDEVKIVDITFSDGSYVLVDFSQSSSGNVDLSIDPRKVCRITSDISLDYYNNFETVVSPLYYTDNGLSGDTIDPTELLYVGGEDIVCSTISQKDNTLFLGDIEIKKPSINSSIKSFFRNQIKSVKFSVGAQSRILNNTPANGYYPYLNQLKYNSQQIKTFKYLETYRVGLQFQYKTGAWSEPIFIGDIENDAPIECSYTGTSKVALNLDTLTDIYIPTIEYALTSSATIQELISLGYKAVRPVIVYPSLSDRTCVCQGVLCPTVFNVEDRFSNSPFAQASWFYRPNAPFDIDAFEEKNWSQVDSDTKYPSIEIDPSNYGWSSIDFFEGARPGTISEKSRSGVLSNVTGNITITGMDIPINIDASNLGSWIEFRHYKPIPDNLKRNAEIQCLYDPEASISTNGATLEHDWVSDHKENFFIDQSIVTLHSPELEFDDSIKSMDFSGLQLRIVGLVPLTAFYGDIDIATSTPAMTIIGDENYRIGYGFYKEGVNSRNISNFGYRALLSGPFWFDELEGAKTNETHTNTAFVVYPFHRNGPLNNSTTETDGVKPSMLESKKLSNLRFSYNTFYLSKASLWNSYVKGDNSKPGISGAVLWDSEEQSVIKIPEPENSDLGDINYYGNVDKVLIAHRKEDGTGYPLVTSYVHVPGNKFHNAFANRYRQLRTTDGDIPEGKTNSINPVRIKYKSSPHAALALNYYKRGGTLVEPTLPSFSVLSETSSVLNVNMPSEYFMNVFWNGKTLNVQTDVIDLSSITSKYNMASESPTGSIGPGFGFLWLGELYRPEVTNRFGGDSEEAIENNQWVVGGEAISLTDNEGNALNSVEVKWTEGDTYYQRYDNLKTYPWTLEDQNAITEIVSFMCETRINIDGRYDRNRGQLTNFAVTPENFNLINTVYSQDNNFFTYRSLNENRLNLDNFHNMITWTKTKTAGELVDKWTNITLASVLDLDGNKGKIRALRRYNNNLVAFQDQGISQILYNENVQLQTDSGMPVELANSGKVQGKRYLSEQVGCTNKWSICETPNGIYFIDDLSKGIYLFNGQIDNLSDRLGFHSWINKESKDVSIWNPKDFKGFVTYYDKINGDVFFISKEECLALSQPLGKFSSFYSYENTPYFANIGDRGIALHTDNSVDSSNYKAWIHNEGDYNMYYNKYQPFSVTVIAGSNSTTDKMFNTVEFRADSWEGETLLNSTFDTLGVWNEYQSNEISLVNIKDKPSNLKRKFRIWRANIPRDKSNNRDRMRNPWLYLKLAMNNENTNKTLLSDIIVHYFE